MCVCVGVEGVGHGKGVTIYQPANVIDSRGSVRITGRACFHSLRFMSRIRGKAGVAEEVALLSFVLFIWIFLPDVELN